LKSAALDSVETNHTTTVVDVIVEEFQKLHDNLQAFAKADKGEEISKHLCDNAVFMSPLHDPITIAAFENIHFSYLTVWKKEGNAWKILTGCSTVRVLP
uniref:DUF4440 domain-containing protein n=1 Tax=Enterobius vermicularis TaxID=51028 RepID=A0A0N4V493_ENTVE